MLGSGSSPGLLDEALDMASRLPFVSVIVPVLNGERTIRECVVSLLKTDYPVERRDILVVDNGSTDRTAEIVKSFPVRYLREERQAWPPQFAYQAPVVGPFDQGYAPRFFPPLPWTAREPKHGAHHSSKGCISRCNRHS